MEDESLIDLIKEFLKSTVELIWSAIEAGVSFLLLCFIEFIMRFKK